MKPENIEITMMVYNKSETDHLHFPPTNKAVFTIKPFDDGYMAYVLMDVLNKNKLDHVFWGNSLHGMGKMKILELVEIIKAYKFVYEIEKDFGC